METNNANRALCHNELAENIQLLAYMESTDSPFVSCYVDLRSGLPSARQYLAGKYGELRKQIEKSVQYEFEQSFEKVLEQLDSVNYTCAGVAIFARSFEGGRFFRVLHLDAPLRNQVTVDYAPDIIPLVMLQHNYGRFLQASISADNIEIYESDLGGRTLRSMAPLRSASSAESRLATATQMLERSMRANRRFEVIIDGEQALMQAVYNTLPRRLRHRVIQCIPQFASDTDEKLRNIGLLTHKRYRENLALQGFNQMVNNGQSLDRIVTGGRSSLKAIESMAVSEIYIGIEDIDIDPFSTPLVNDYKSLLGVFCLAIRQDTPIKFISGNKLTRRGGGIACVLHEEAILYRVLPAKPGASLEMVA